MLSRNTKQQVRTAAADWMKARKAVVMIRNFIGARILFLYFWREKANKIFMCMIFTLHRAKVK